MLAGLFSLLSNILFFTGYIQNSKSFEKPLSNEREYDLLIKSSKGDKEAKNELIKHNMRLVVHIVKKYNTYPDCDELVNVGNYGLFKAINSFSLEKNTKFATYAARCIENEILMYIRANKKSKEMKYLYESIGFDKDGNEIPLIDLIKDEEETIAFYDQKKLKELLNKMIDSSLNIREKEILELRFGLNDKKELTQKEIAKIYNISRSYVSRIETKALKKLRIYAKQNNIEF